MYVRLAFSVAAHLEPEILLIDEVLAVGDVGFQKKSLGKMESVSQQGRTVIFVSHNMNALQRLCPHSILLDHGSLVTQDTTSKVIEQYLSAVSSESIGPNQLINFTNQKRDGTGKIQFQSISYAGTDSSLGYHPYTNDSVNIDLNLIAQCSGPVGSIAVTIYDRYGTKLVNADTSSFGQPVELREGENTLKFRIDQLHLNPGTYVMALWAADPPMEVYDYIPSAILFEVIETEKKNIRMQSDGLVPVEFSFSRVD
jgi:ABC-type sulfate/molybdate transport systems ATPase subunit